MSSNELATKAKDLHELRSMISELQAEADTIEAEFKAFMEAQGADTITAGAFRLTWKAVTSSRFDTTGFKSAMPELAARFMKQT
ncbi:MAG: hypothetical protein EOM58_13485, partial [Clostridia bacterium]|nr:hypothetical protein [Clostridia bacterium]